jgi:hypothetical protein
MSSNTPYLEKTIRVYNPDYGDLRICNCGHHYYRHFDGYEGNAPVGCKYCKCSTFVEAALEDRPVVLSKDDIAQYSYIGLVRHEDSPYPVGVILPVEFIETLGRNMHFIMQALERADLGDNPAFYYEAAKAICKVADDTEKAVRQFRDSETLNSPDA